MPASYVVRRGDAYHFRLRVPRDLVGAMGSRELHSSLGHARRKSAEQRAAFLAFHAHAFFGMVRRLMRTMTPQEVATLVEEWRRRMFERDGEVRLLIQRGTHPLHRMSSYVRLCEGMHDQAEAAFEGLFDSEEAHEDWREPNEADQREALALARFLITSDDDKDDADGRMPLMNAKEFDELDALGQREVAWQFLQAAGNVYSQKSRLARNPKATTAATGLRPTTAPAQAASPPVTAGGRAGAMGDRWAAEIPATSPAAQITIGAAWEAYCKSRVRKEASWKKAGGPPDNARKAWPLFEAVMGRDSLLSTITVPSLRRYVAIAEAMPRLDRKPYKDMPLEIVVALAEQGEIPEEERRATSTLQNTTAEIGRFVMKFCCVDYGLQIPEAFKCEPQGRQADDEDAETTYDPWSAEDIQRMFEPAVLVAEARRLRANATRNQHPRVTYRDGVQWADWPWLLLLALYTGARRSELVGLAADDVLVSHENTRRQHGVDVPVLLIRKNKHRGLKNPASERCVPIHPDLIAMGFLSFVEQRRIRGDERLLYTVGTVNVGGGKAAEALTDYAEALGTRREGERKVFHSFRHSFKTQGIGAMSGDHLDGITGHKRKGSEMTRYEHGLEIAQHERAAGLAKMRFGLDVEGMRDALAELRAEVGR